MINQTEQAPDQTRPSSPGAGVAAVNTLRDLATCCRAWAPEARIIGNVRADDAANALEFAISALQQPSGWQPIETAPKNGRTLLLGYFNTLGKWWATRGQWCSRELLDEEWEDGDLCDEGWYETSVEHEQSYFISPTHWMPLPSPPEVQP